MKSNTDLMISTTGTVVSYKIELNLDGTDMGKNTPKRKLEMLYRSFMGRGTFQ